MGRRRERKWRRRENGREIWKEETVQADSSLQPVLFQCQMYSGIRIRKQVSDSLPLSDFKGKDDFFPILQTTLTIFPFTCFLTASSFSRRISSGSRWSSQYRSLWVNTQSRTLRAAISATNWSSKSHQHNNYFEPC